MKPQTPLEAGVFLDTSALYATFDVRDSSHERASEAWRRLVQADAPLHCSDYVVVELTALLQTRLGIAAVDAMSAHVLPWVNLVWVDKGLHAQGTAALLAARRRELSLVDCISFAAMRSLGLRTVFTLDPHFAEQGFTVLPEPLR
jgi:uncharacterized protein